MGRCRGHSIKETRASLLHDARRKARKAFLAFSGNDRGNKLLHAESSEPETGDSTTVDNNYDFSSLSAYVYVVNPKQDLYGLGYDPFKNAPEFKERKLLHESRDEQDVKKGFIMKGNHSGLNSGKYAPSFGIGAFEELDVKDEDIYYSDFGFVMTDVEDHEPAELIIDNKLMLENTKKGLSGFKVASSSDNI